MHTTTHAPISARPRSRTLEVKSGVCDITCRARLLLQPALLVLAVIIGLVKNETSADEVAKAADRIVNTKFAAAVSIAVQDARSFDVFAIAPAERKIHRFTAKQLMTGVPTPAASFQFEGEPQRVIVRSIGDTQFAFVQCANPMMLVQLEAESLNVVHQIPLSTSVVSDMFASEALDDSCVWLVIDGKPVKSRSTIRQWKLAVVNFGGDAPNMVDLLDCSAALVTPDGKTVLTYHSGQGVTRSAVSFNDDRSLSLTMLPEQPSLAKIRLRPGSFFSPDQDAIIVAGQWLATDDSVVDAAVPNPGDVSPAFSAPIISFLRSTPLAVCLSQRTLDDGTMEPSLQFVETPSGKVLSTLAIGDGVDLTRGGRDWRICETPDNSGLLHVASTHVRFLPNTTLPTELKELLNAPPMTLQNRPDLAFRIGEVKEVPMQPTDPRCSMTLRTAPEGMTLTDGILRWQPGVVQQGKHTVEIEFTAGSLTKTVRLQARVEFDVQKLPASYYRFAYSPKLQLLAGATLKADRTLAIDILRTDDTGQFAMMHSMPLHGLVTGLAFAPVDGQSEMLVASLTAGGSLVVFDPLTGMKTGEFDKSLPSVMTLTVGVGSQRSLLVYGGSQGGSGQVDCAGLVDLKSSKHVGFFCAVPMGKLGHPQRIVISLEPSRRYSQQNSIHQASISSDGETVHFITRTNESSVRFEYSEWTIPDDFSRESSELTCLYRADIPEPQGGFRDLRMLSGGTGYAAIRSRLFKFGQPSESGFALDVPHHFVTGRPFLIQSHVSDADHQSIQAGGAPAMKVSVVPLNGERSVAPQFTIPMGPVVSQNSMGNALLCVSDEATKMAIFARSESLIRIPYSVMGIDDQTLDPTVIISNPRLLQAGSEYEMPLKMFPSTAKVSMNEAPAGARIEGNLLKWKVAADAEDQEAIRLTVSDGEKSKAMEIQFRVVATVPVETNHTVPRYTFDSESGLIAGMDSETGNIVVFDIERLRSGNNIPHRTLKLEGTGSHQCVEFKRVEDQLLLIVVSDSARRLRVIDVDSEDVKFDFTGRVTLGTTEILASPDRRSPLVVLKSAGQLPREGNWRFLNVKTGEIGLTATNQQILSFSGKGTSLALRDARASTQLVVADIVDAATDGVPSLTNFRTILQSNTDDSIDGTVDFDFYRLHQGGVVFSANGLMNGETTTLHPAAFFRKSPFFLSLSTTEPADPNQRTVNDAISDAVLSVVSRNTLKPVGKQVTLQIPRSSFSSQQFPRPQPAQVFVTDDEKTVLITSPQACFVLHIEALRLPDEISLALDSTNGAFFTGMESAVDLRTVDSRVTISIPSLPEGMTFEGGKLKWTPKLSNVGSYPLNIQLHAGDRKRSETISIRAVMPHTELPFPIAGLSAEPQRNLAFIWGRPHREKDTEIDLPATFPLCVIDLTTRKTMTQSTIATDEILVAMFEGRYVIVGVEQRSGARLVVLNSHDLSVVASVPLQSPTGLLGFVRKDRTLFVSQEEQLLRFSMLDLKWEDGDAPAPGAKPGSFPGRLSTEGIVQGLLTLNWDRSPKLWHGPNGGHLHAEGVELQPEFHPTIPETANSFLSDDLRIVSGSASSMTYIPSAASKRSPLHASVAGRAQQIQPQISLCLSSVSSSPLRVFQSESESDGGDSLPTDTYGGRSKSILLDDQPFGTSHSWVAMTDNSVLVGNGNKLRIVAYDQAELLLNTPPRRPAFIRQQSHFLLQGLGQTKLSHSIRDGHPGIRFAKANRIAGVSVDSPTGDVKVDHKIIADTMYEKMTDKLHSIGVFNTRKPLETSVVMELISRHSDEICRQVIRVGEKLPDGIPVFVPIELILLDDGQPVDALGYTVAVMVSKETIMAAIDECLQKDVEMRTGKRSQPQDDVEELRRIIDRLEERLNRAESMLRENGLDVPKQ